MQQKQQETDMIENKINFLDYMEELKKERNETKGFKARAYCFTDFILDTLFYNDIECQYIILGEEICPKTKRKHWQGYIYFKNQRSFSSIIKQFTPRHIEACKGSPQQNITYCSKDNVIILEKGEKPKQGGRTDLEAVSAMIKEKNTIKEIATEHPTTYIKYHRGIEKLNALINPPEPGNWAKEIIVHWGPTKCGKTYLAKQAGGEKITYTGESGFFLGYTNQPIIIFDEFDPKKWTKEFFNEITDQYAMKINVKGGDMEWNPKTIYITCRMHPSEWDWYNEEVERRITKIIEFKPRNGGIEKPTEWIYDSNKVGSEVMAQKCEGNTRPRTHNIKCPKPLRSLLITTKEEIIE